MTPLTTAEIRTHCTDAYGDKFIQLMTEYHFDCLKDIPEEIGQEFLNKLKENEHV